MNQSALNNARTHSPALVFQALIPPPSVHRAPGLDSWFCPAVAAVVSVVLPVSVSHVSLLPALLSSAACSAASSAPLASGFLYIRTMTLTLKEA